MNFPAIYKIVNRLDSKYYVGSTRRIVGCKGRWHQHRYSLNKNKHHNDYLQNAWNKYSPSSFDFVIVKRLDNKISDYDLLKEEQVFLDIAKTDPLSYNLTFVANNPNLSLSDYSKKKRSDSLKRVIRTDEWKLNISKSHMGIRPSVTSRQKMKLAKEGKRQSKLQVENATKSRRKNWTFISPTGKITHIYDLKSFCREYGLHSGNMYWVASGQRSQHRGWRKYELPES